MNKAIYVKCYPKSKQPIGNNWGDNLLTREAIEKLLAENPHLNVGLILGPISGLIDVECDDEKAIESFNKFFVNLVTPCWQSLRGRHYLFQYDPRLADLPSVVKWQGIEFRLGTKSSQSIIPPSIVDGVQRQWIISLQQYAPLALPVSIIQELLALPKQQKTSISNTDLPEQKNKTVKKIKKYCERVGLPIVSIKEDYEGRVFINLQQCPFSHAEHQNGGAPAFIINKDGSVGFHCFHPDCANKIIKDVEEKFGPITPIITIGPDLYKNVEQAIQALCTDDNTYQRGGVLVEIVHDAPKPKLCLHDDGNARLRPIPAPTLATKLSNVAKFQKWNATKNQYVNCLPPDNLVHAVLASPEYLGIPVVTGVVSCAVLRSDGTIASDSGYDPSTGLFMEVAA